MSTQSRFDAETEEELAILQTVADFAAQRVAPLAARIDQDDRIPNALYAELAQLGLLGMLVSEKHGGSELSTVLFSQVVEEIAATSAAVANAMCVGVEIAHFMATYANEAQQTEWLPGIIAGDIIPGIAITEPEAGSDVSRVSMRATRTEGGWVLNGTKTFITNAVHGSLFITIARTGGEGKEGMTGFLVRGDAPGLVRGAKSPFLGIRGLGTTELIYEDCFVADADVIGVEGQGFELAMANINLGRIAMGSEALGIARAAVEEAIDYALTREQFGRAVYRFQGVSFPLADLATRVDAARLLLHRAGRYRDQMRDYRLEASMAKHFASETAMQAADEAMHVWGAYGYSMESRVQRLFRDAKLTQVYEGSRNVQRMIIASELKGASMKRRGR